MDTDRLDDLPPVARFALRAAAAGVTTPRIAALLDAPEADALQHLRAALRGCGVTPPAPVRPESELWTALDPLLEAARRAPRRPPSTACPGADVLAAVGSPEIHGPLLLATLDHAADCPACLRAVLAADPEPTAATPPAPTHGKLELILGAAVGLAAALWYLFLR